MIERLIVVAIIVLLLALVVLIVLDQISMEPPQGEKLHFIYMPIPNGGVTALPVYY